VVVRELGGQALGHHARNQSRQELMQLKEWQVRTLLDSIELFTFVVFVTHLKLEM
jgi:hypothetical protein